METSDSECFESADEEFYPDENKVKTVKKIKEQFSNLNVNDDKKYVVFEQAKSSAALETKEKSMCPDEVKDVSTKILPHLDNSKDNLKSKCQITNTINKNSVCKESLENVDSKDKIENKIINSPNANDGWDIDDDDALGNEESLWKDDEISWKFQNNLPPENYVKNSNFNKNDNNLGNSENVNWKSTPQFSSCKDIHENSSLKKDDSWGGWGNWEVSSILTTATHGMSTLTNHVSQGFSTVLETGMGIPDPKELAQLHYREETLRDKLSNDNIEQEKVDTNVGDGGGGMGFGFTNLVSGVTKFVETTSTKVISGGLDTLETIGKKTMQVLQEGDPGLKKKRSFLKLEQEKPILSQILREAKEKAARESTLTQEDHVRKDNYEKLFDDHHGLVHLEALEMLSKQCEIKLQMLTATRDEKSLIEIQETLDQVKELCELPNEDDDEQPTLEDIKERLKVAVDELKINITYEKLLSTWEETELWLSNVKLNICDENELHQQAILTLAQLTAIAVEQYHKAGELLLIKEHRSTADEADSLVQITTSLISLMGIVAAKFSDKLNLKPSADGKGLITNVFFEAANSSSYIQDAFQLLIPVLQAGAV